MTFTSKGVSVAQRLFRAGRIVVISYGIYQCGYQAGLSDVINDPVGTNKTLMQMVYQTQGATGESKDAVMKRRSRVVGKRVLAACKDYCMQKYIVAHSNAQEHGVALSDCEDVVKWKTAVENLRSHEWSFVVINAPSVNAFVNHLMPGKVFIHEGLFREVRPTDDELALILSHELSHLIHQHGQSRTELSVFISIMQLVLFSFVDPSGVLPFVFDVVVKKFGTGMENFYSRENETEADLTGIEIAALGCFDTKKAHEVFGRLGGGDEEHYVSASWNSTHPSGQSRVEYLLEASGVHNPEALGDKCKKMKGFLDDVKVMLKGGVGL
jgi:hypothetical protein